MKNKEDVLDFYDKASKSFITQETTYVNREAALKAMESFSASQNSELKNIIKQTTEDFAVKVQGLKKENEELERRWGIVADGLNEAQDTIEKLQSTIEEKDDKINGLEILLDAAKKANELNR